jgi:hypothetical protein
MLFTSPDMFVFAVSHKDEAVLDMPFQRLDRKFNLNEVAF